MPTDRNFLDASRFVKTVFSKTPLPLHHVPPIPDPLLHEHVVKLASSWADLFRQPRAMPRPSAVSSRRPHAEEDVVTSPPPPFAYFQPKMLQFRCVQATERLPNIFAFLSVFVCTNARGPPPNLTPTAWNRARRGGIYRARNRLPATCRRFVTRVCNAAPKTQRPPTGRCRDFCSSASMSRRRFEREERHAMVTRTSTSVTEVVDTRQTFGFLPGR